MISEDSISLVSETFDVDENGFEKQSLSERDVFAEIYSVSQSEFFEAGRNGFKPEMKVRVWSVEYNNERLAKYHDVVYEIYRTYVFGDKTELYLQRGVDLK